MFFLRQFLLLVLLVTGSAAWGAGKVDQITKEGVARAGEGKEAQGRVNKISDATADVVSDFKTESKVVDGLIVYNTLLQRQIDFQVEEMASLSESIDNVSLIERQIVPLMTRMIDALEQFVGLDVPFLPQERTERVDRLKKMMLRADVTSAEKFRRVLEAFQIENDYGRTIEAYKGSIEQGGQSKQVDFLRIGRVALLYQTVGGDSTGAWDKSSKTWVDLPPAEYRRPVLKGLSIARKQIAPDLLVLPISAPQESK